MFNKIKSSVLSGISYMRKRVSATKLCACIMVLFSLVVTLLIFRNILSFEMHHAYHADSPLYWTVGRGMLNGLTPYVDMYENKPIGVFLISAISFGLTGGTILCNIMSCLAAVMITFLPALILLNKYKNLKDEISPVRKTAVFLTIMLCGLIIAVYSESRSWALQVEAIGAAFSVLFICLVAKLKTVQTRGKRVGVTILAALAISFAVMFKEPFVLVSVFGALLFIDNFREFLKNLLLPCVAGGVFVLIVLADGEVLIPYFTIYIKRMFETRLAGESSAFTRAGDLAKIFNDVKDFGAGLIYILIGFVILAILWAIYKKRSVASILFFAFKAAAAVFAASFCVGMGGQYYNHHFIFAVPVYCAFLLFAGEALFELKPKKTVVRSAVIILWSFVLFISTLSVGNHFAGDYTDRFNAISKKAEYVDAMLDFYHEDRYQYIGFNGEDVFIGLTKHSPQGPVFGQDSDNFQSPDTWFSKKLIEQINESNIVIVNVFLSPAIDSQIQFILDTDFTLTPKASYYVPSPLDAHYKIYFRKSKFGI